jgi:hypothetical protein
VDIKADDSFKYIDDYDVVVDDIDDDYFDNFHNCILNLLFNIDTVAECE